MGDIMEFIGISPFARFVRHMEINMNSVFPVYIPLDARLFYVLKGEGRIEIGGIEQILEVGSVLYVNAGVEYHLLPCEAEYLAVNFDFTDKNRRIDTPLPPVQAENSKEAELLEKVEFSDAVCFNEYCIMRECQMLRSKLLRLEQEYVKKLSFYRNETSSILASVLTYIARSAEERPQKEGRFDINEVMAYINEHYAETLDNYTLSEIFHFHPNYISAEFKRYTGKPLHRYVLEKRILSAVSLIESGHNDIAEIAALTAFSDVNYFSRYFKRIIGTSPGRYIKNCVAVENKN